MKDTIKRYWQAISTPSKYYSLGFLTLGGRGRVNGQQSSGVVVAGDVVSAHRLCSHKGESSRNGQGAPDDGTVGQEHQADQQGGDAFILHHGSSL